MCLLITTIHVRWERHRRTWKLLMQTGNKFVRRLIRKILNIPNIQKSKNNKCNRNRQSIYSDVVMCMPCDVRWCYAIVLLLFRKKLKMCSTFYITFSKASPRTPNASSWCLTSWPDMQHRHLLQTHSSVLKKNNVKHRRGRLTKKC